MGYIIFCVSAILFCSKIGTYLASLQITSMSQDAYLEDTFFKTGEILKSYFNSENHQLMIIINTTMPPADFIKHINDEEFCYSIVTVRFVDTHHVTQPHHYFLIFVDEFFNMGYIIRQLRNKVLWEFGSRFMFILIRPLPEETNYQLEEIFKFLRQDNVLLSLVIFWTYSDLSQRTMNSSISSQNFKLFMYNSSHCSKEEIYVRDISAQWLVFGNLDPILPNSSHNHCSELKIAMFPEPTRAIPIIKDDIIINYDGSDGQTINSIAKYMNMTPVWIPINFEVSFGFRKNGTITGTTGDVAYDRADIAPNSRYINVGWPEVKHTYPHDTDNLVFIVPKSKRVPQYKHIFLPFSIYVWTILLFTILFNSLTWYCIRKCVNYFVGNRLNVTVGKSFFDVFRSFITGTTNTIPNSTLERVSIIIWLFYGIIMTSAFQGSLTSFLTVPKYLKDINTLKELATSRIGLYAYAGIESFLEFDESDITLANLWKKFTLSGNYIEVIIYVAEHDDMGFMMNDYSMKLMLRQTMFIKDGDPLLHQVEENIRTAYNAYEVPRNSPYLDTFNFVIRRLSEAGLQGKWFRDTMFMYLVYGNITDESTFKSAKTSPLSLKHMQTPFYILSIGIIVSFVIFIYEIFRRRESSPKATIHNRHNGRKKYGNH